MVTCYDTSGAALEKVYQWDMNRAVTVKAEDAPAAPVFHFCAAGDKAALVVTPTSDAAGFTAQIPNLLLQQRETIYLYLTGSTGDEVATSDVAAIAVEPRPQPEDYAYVEDHQSVSLAAISAQVTAAIAAFQTSLTTATAGAATAAQQAQSAAAAATEAADGADTAASGAQSAQTAAAAAAQAAATAASAANTAANAALEAATAANQAVESMGEGGVVSFNGRTGTVIPASGDYTAAQVGADAFGSAETVQAHLDTHIGSTGNPHGVTAAQVGARPSTWTPSAAEVGARPATWTPTASDVGARPSTWTPTAADVGAEPSGAVDFHNAASGAHGTLFAAKADKSTIVNATLAASSWEGTAAPFTYTLSVAGVTTTSNQEILPSLTITQEQLEALQGANIVDGGQASGSITLKAWGGKPGVDIPVRVIKRGDM